MRDLVKKNKLLLTMLVVYGLVFMVNGQKALLGINKSTYYLIEMAQILPVIFMLTVSIDVLVPKEWIVKRLGKESGFLGILLSLMFGSLSAGPIYAAFPIAKMLHKKGASLGNIVIILSSWAVIKVPMLANEAKFLGPKFMAIRWLLTVVFIILLALIMEKSGLKIQGQSSSHNSYRDGHLLVNTDYCVGCGLCSRSNPQVFELKNKKAYVKQEQGMSQNSDKEEIQVIVDKCPTQAIYRYSLK